MRILAIIRITNFGDLRILAKSSAMCAGNVCWLIQESAGNCSLRQNCSIAFYSFREARSHATFGVSDSLEIACNQDLRSAYRISLRKFLHLRILAKSSAMCAGCLTWSSQSSDRATFCLHSRVILTSLFSVGSVG